MKNKIEDLRNHLFAQLEKLTDCPDEKLPIEINRAASMVQIAETIIDSGRAETEFLEATTKDASDGTKFFPVAKEQRKFFIEKDTGKDIEPIEKPKAVYSNHRPYDFSTDTAIKDDSPETLTT